MALFPFLVGEYPRRHPSRLFDQHFGLGLTPNDVLTVTMRPISNREYYRPWRNMVATKDLGSRITCDSDNFQVSLDVQHFSPEEISVKTADGYVIIEGKHEEKKDQHGYVSRQFVRKYALPGNTKPESVVSKLSSDGVLTITAPKIIPEGLKGERKIPITQTGPVRKAVKDQNEGTENKEIKSRQVMVWTEPRSD